MRLVSVNVGLPRDATWQGRPVRTGIVKDPVEGPIEVRGVNLAGDAQADPTVHGGVDKAVYGYPSEHYPHWRETLEVDVLPWGAFGENLTTEGLLETEVGIGDRFRIGTTLLEVSQPRIPCHKLALRHGRVDLPKRFLQSGRSGFYFRIVEEGRLAVGDAIERVHRDPADLSVADVQSLIRGGVGFGGDEALLRRAVAHPALAAAWRDPLREKLGGSSRGAS